MPAPLVGCAGWNLGREHVAAFPAEGTHLQRYGARLDCVEINSSFYRPHRHQTYVRWAQSVPEGFRFSVKVPKLITHVQRLRECAGLLDEFLQQCSGLGERLGCLLVQLPPSLAFEQAVADEFFSALRERYEGGAVLEPRHGTWSVSGPLLCHHRIAQAAVDPSRFAGDLQPAGWPGLKYWRLHGSPRIYHDAYGASYRERLAPQLRTAQNEGAQAWCVFDNTASGAALGDALALHGCLS